MEHIQAKTLHVLKLNLIYDKNRVNPSFSEKNPQTPQSPGEPTVNLCCHLLSGPCHYISFFLNLSETLEASSGHFMEQVKDFFCEIFNEVFYFG